MKSVLSYIFGLMFIVCAVVYSVDSIALNPSFYEIRYEKMELASSLGVSSTDLNNSIEILLDYVSDKTDNMELSITRFDEKQEAFNEKEKTHMVDVKALYQNAIKVALVCFVVMIGILFYFVLFERKLALSYLSRGFLRAVVCLTVLLSVFGFWIAYDFTAFWNWFHTIFFTNDLWLLNPATDFMICMLPEIIFNELVLKISMMVIFILVPVTLFSLYYQFKKAPIGFER